MRPRDPYAPNDDRTDLDLVGRRLESELIEHSVMMKFDGGWSLLITSPFTLNTLTESHIFTPDKDPPAAFEPVRQLTGRTVRHAHATEHGALEVVFANDHTIHVAPDPDYESWTVSGPAGHLMVSMAGGELATWDAGPQPITREDAVRRAERAVEELVRTQRLGDVIVVYDAILETRDAWHVPYQSRAYVERGDVSNALAGNLPIRVPKDGGPITREHFPPEHRA